MRIAIRNIMAALLMALLLAILALMHQPAATAGQAGGYPVEPNLRAIRILPSGGALTVKDSGSPQVWMASSGLAAYTVGTQQLQLCQSRDPDYGYCTSGEVDPNGMLELFPVTDPMGAFLAHGIYSMLDNSDPWSFAPLALSTSEVMMIRLNRGGANDFAVPALQFSIGATQHRISSLLDQEADTLAPFTIRASEITLSADDASALTLSAGLAVVTDPVGTVDVSPMAVVYDTDGCTEVQNLGNAASLIASCVENETGDITLTLDVPYSAAPICQATAFGPSDDFGLKAQFLSVTASTIRVELEDAGGDAQDGVVGVTCHGLHST